MSIFEGTGDHTKQILALGCFLVLLLNGLLILIPPIHTQAAQIHQPLNDYDPLLDLFFTIEISEIRALDPIDLLSKPDFYVLVTINDETFQSPLWQDTEYVHETWTVTTDIPDNEEIVDITIQLWDYNIGLNTKCDISSTENNLLQGYDIFLKYSIKTGRWYGDDYLISDCDGYGRACGTSDGSIYQDENDCELFFNMYQNDYDNDGLPYWIETQIYTTDPTINNTGEDTDNDGVPIEWEHRWGFHPGIWEDHEHMDHDQDSLTNVEEYLTNAYGSDPYRKDVFLELDFMQTSPDNISSIIPDEAIELLKNPFHRRNIVFHVDTTVHGGDIIPYDEETTFQEVREIYNIYFIDHYQADWKRNVFHYGIIAYKSTPNGYGFSGDISPYMGYIPGTNGFIISSSIMEKNTRRSLTKTLPYFYGSAIMHEMGHNFGIRGGNPPGCDVQLSKWPWQIGYRFYRTYESIMNYHYTYKIFDYSDGSHGKRDSDDWEAIDLTYFEIPK